MLFFKTKRRVRELTHVLDSVSAKIAELEKQHSAIQAIMESMVEGVIAVDKDTRILFVNPSIEKIFGIFGKEAKGRFFLEMIRNNDIAGIIDEVLKTGKFVSLELNLVWPVQRVFEIHASPVFENSIVTGCSIVIHDITEIRRLETVRRDFVANVSHELKTPLTSIKGFVETLLEGALEDKEHNRNFLNIIQNHTERLNSLVDDLLSLSYLESKEMVPEKKDLDLRQQLEDVSLGFRFQLQKKNIDLKNELPPGLSLRGDREKIAQVFTNLIDNALKFNKENGAIRVFGQEIDGRIKVTVEDSGIGIPAKDLPRIFERFYRVDKARSRELGGTGLGLSIVKHIIELHKGSVGVESAEGFGSKFWFTLPK